MTRVEPRLAWTTPFGVSATAPFLLLSKERAWAWRSALALSVAVHAGLALLVGDAVLDAANRAPSPQIEVDLVVPAAPEAAVAAPGAASPAVAAPTPPPPPAPAPAEQQAPPAKTAPAAAETEPSVNPVPQEPPAAPPPQTAASPPPEPKPEPKIKPSIEPKPEPPVREKAEPARPAHTKPEPAQRPVPLRPQIAARPPAAESGHGVEGRQSARETDMGAEATVRAILSPAPRYPPIAVQWLEEGTVVVRIDIDDNGVAKAASVLTSSGYGSLDQAAVAAARRWRFAVPKQGSHAVAHTVDVPFVFNLKHASR